MSAAARRRYVRRRVGAPGGDDENRQDGRGETCARAKNPRWGLVPAEAKLAEVRKGGGGRANKVLGWLFVLSRDRLLPRGRLTDNSLRF